MRPPQVVIVETGTANLASVRAGLERAGATVRPADTPEDVGTAERLVLPGVGAFGAAMQVLAAAGFVELLRARVASGKPTLAICLGMQLLFEESEEAPGTTGLGIAAGRLRRFPSTVRCPQLGWNTVRTEPGFPCPGGVAYFANSFRAETAPQGWSVAWAEYGGRYVAALARGRVLACQFHPELSGVWGLRWLRAWLSDEETSPPPLAKPPAMSEEPRC